MSKEDSAIENEIEKLRKFDDEYFNNSPKIPDHQYDQYKDRVREKLPNHPYFHEIGHDVRSGKIDLPYTMGGLDQIHDGEFLKWIHKNELENQSLIISEKLDGISVLLLYKKVNGDSLTLQNAYSRGNGIQGADITRHIKHIKFVPQNINIDADLIAIRAEVIIKDEIFEKKYSSKYKNARQMVAGCMNRKSTDLNILKDIDVVCYEIIDILNYKENDEIINTKVKSLNFLKNLNFLVVQYDQENSNSCNDSFLSNKLEKMRKDSKYTIDGLVITVNDISKLKYFKNENSLNPKHSIKYKVLSENSVVETEVIDVHWKLSKSNYWKPRIEIKPVDLFGTTVTYATGFNGKFIYDNKIGPGASIKITKAGEVIPYVVSVTKSATDVAMPTHPWKWDSLGVELISLDESSPEVVIMQLIHFFKTIGVEYLQEKTLRKLIDHYDLFNNTNGDFSSMTKEIIGLLDVQWKRALGENGNKIFLSLHTILSNIKPETLLGATPFFTFGFGIRKAKKLMDSITFEDFLNYTTEKDIKNIEGFDKTALDVHNGIGPFKIFYNSIYDYVEFETIEKDNSLNGEVIVMTGFRDKTIKDFIENSGGRVATSISKKTTKLIAADPKSNSSKIKKAKELNIPILSFTEFKYQYIK